MANRPSPRANAVARGAPLVMLLLAGAGLVGVVFLLGQVASTQNAALIAGLAGATTATVALLIQPGGWRYLQSWITRYGAYVALVWFVGGFMFAGFGVLAATTLLGARASLSGAAVSGALLGLVVGFVGAGRAATSRVAESETVLGSGLLGAGEAVTNLVNYDGEVVASFARAEGDLVAGRVTGRLRPRTSRVPQRPGEVREVRARVLVQGGDDEATAPFAVSVVPSGALVGYPRQTLVSAPVDRDSEEFEFTVVRDGPGPDADFYRPAGLLLDISQAGRTIQLVEIPLG